MVGPAKATLLFLGALALTPAAGGLARALDGAAVYGPFASRGGAYLATLRSDLAPPTINRIHSWSLKLADASGAPVDAGPVTIDAGVPIIGRVMPTAARARKGAGAGEFVIEGMKFDMAGRWRVEVHVGSGPASDLVSFDVDVK